MVYQTMDNCTSGLLCIFQTASSGVTTASTNLGASPFISLPAMIMFALFIIISFVSYFAQQRRIGTGNLPASMAIAGFVVCVVGVFFGMIPNFMPSSILINPEVYAVVIEIILVFWLLYSGRE
jgi:cytochrome bd-type quinol oxidase subunit 2